MTTPSRHSRRGAATGDVLIFLGTLSVAAALLYPAWSTRDFRTTVATAIADVETLGAAARSVRDNGNRWPTSSAPGEQPPEIYGLDGEGGLFGRLGYTLGWTSWEVVDSVPAPPPPDLAPVDDAPRGSDAPRMQPLVRRVGAVTVHSGNQALLAELLEHYTDRASFVLDTTWVLVLPERADAPAPR